jgi:hypothetical protein
LPSTSLEPRSWLPGCYSIADASVPLLGKGFIETPRISVWRSIVYFILFLVCLYFGFVRKPKS